MVISLKLGGMIPCILGRKIINPYFHDDFWKKRDCPKMGHPLNSNVSHHVPSYLMAIFLGIPHFQTWRVPKIWVHGTPQWFSHWQKTITWMILGYHPRAQGSHAPRRAAPQSSRRYGDRVVVPRQGPETGRNYGCFCHMMGIRFLDIFGGTWEGNWADTLLSGVDSLWGELGDSNWPKMREMREWTNTFEKLVDG